MTPSLALRPRLARLAALGLALAACALALGAPARAADDEPAAPTLAARGDPAEQVIATAIKAALANDFKAWLATLHPNERATPEQQSQLEKYTFKRVAKQAGWYVRNGDATTFEVARREDMGGGRVKIFLKDLTHASRAPVPIALEQTAGGGWAIIAISL